MSSTTNTMGIQMSIITSTAATVSKVEFTTKGAGKAQASFDGILNKVSDSMLQTKVVDVKKNAGQEINPKQAYQTDNSQGNDQNLQNTDKVKDIDNTKVNDENTANLQEENTDQQVNEVNTTEVKETEGKEANKELQSAIEECGKELISEMAKALDISEEDILSAMELLGLTFADLLNPQNLQQLVTDLGGQDKALDLITDSDLSTFMQDLFEDADSMKSELMNEFDLSPEQFEEVVNEIKEDFGAHIEKAQEKTPEIIVDQKQPELTKELTASQSKESTPIIKTEITPENEAEVETEFKPVEMSGQTSKDNNESSNNNLSGQAQNPNLFNQLLNNLTENIDVVPTGPAEYTDRAQMENIIRQIADRITITSAAEEHSIEMQLHPASLGNVNILLTSSKEGIVAKFTAQNEIVKEAVETQMMTLQQKFNEQGIKVTSIEVTIASHAFEQNLQQGDDNNNAFNQQQAKKGRTLRRINLAEIDEDGEAEAMNDADRIAAQMMAANGNSVDFSA
ncbi:flagellar hook-length control protein FliK [Butyrivibrio sp. VCB2006]|uniref:flagellar hook-length control protein FliK n=1 Tax=Butyrivibrio sp. VCB2006 TaxID=1280679 RepID=UPI000411B110|nr:flagellar hook-length control protein FliK [Butyrivibrio sp. VCB2006]